MQCQQQQNGGCRMTDVGDGAGAGREAWHPQCKLYQRVLGGLSPHEYDAPLRYINGTATNRWGSHDMLKLSIAFICCGDSPNFVFSWSNAKISFPCSSDENFVTTGTFCCKFQHSKTTKTNDEVNNTIINKVCINVNILNSEWNEMILKVVNSMLLLWYLSI